MARQLIVDLVFNANTSQAKSQMQSLHSSIQMVQNTLNQQVSMSGMTAELAKVQNSVISLKTNLASAFNVNTGRLDLTKFNSNLMRSGQTIKDYRMALQQLGPTGVQAFNQLSQAVLQGQMPLQRMGGLVGNLMTTFGNSIKWSLAYGAINKIAQGFQNAFQYAQDLNESLTNIRVVTGLGADEMERFAEKANKAAKILATTTTAYTDAALIYYQQGLTGQAVEERAETTLKLANVTGQTAETVSDQMTAVWNNFYDGSKSLEYYADVLAALGAATASSTDEISQGLEKFAAVADTVGLSYEYATTALATVTAQTRQSADVVGTAFKTLFARIQDLELGDTLEDGTTLGSYSEALAKVGVNIKNADGSLKDMNNILDEMGAKWKQIDKDQQVALAKSVAGIRQYTQLIALMDNWDTFEMNLVVAENSEGTLEEQQKIWAESWDAASKRVKASAEDLFNSLIDDKFFIDLSNIFADLLDGLDEFIDSIGGLKTLLPLVAGWMMKAFGPSMLNAITNLKTNMFGTSASQRAMVNQQRTEVMNQQSILANNTGGQVGTTMSQTLSQQKAFLKEIEAITRSLPDSEVARLQFMQQETSELANQAIYYAQQVDDLQTRNELLSQTVKSANLDAQLYGENLSRMGVPGGNDALLRSTTQMNFAAQADIQAQSFNSQAFMSENGTMNFQAATQSAQELVNVLKQVPTTEAGFEHLVAKLELLASQGLNSAESMQLFEAELKKVSSTDATAATIQEELNALFVDGQADVRGFVAALREKSKAEVETVANDNKMTAGMRNTESALDQLRLKIKDYIKEAQAMAKQPLGATLMQGVSGMAMAAAGASMLVNSLESLNDIAKGGEATLGTWLGIISGMGFALPMLISGFKSLGTAMGFLNTYVAIENTLLKLSNDQKARDVTLTTEQIAAENAAAIAEMFGIGVDQAKLLLDEQGNIMKGKAIALSVSYKAAKILETMTTAMGIPVKYADATASAAAAGATYAMIWPIGLLMLAVAALVLIIWGLIAAFKAIQASTPEAKFAAAKEELNALNSTLEETTSKFEELQQTIEDYQDSYDALETMVEGTEEWRDAVADVNAQVLELMSTYPELAQYVASKNGVLSISEDGLQIVEDNMRALVQQQTLAVQAQKAIVAKAKINLNLKDFELDHTQTDAGGGGPNSGDTTYSYKKDDGSLVELGSLKSGGITTDQFIEEMQKLYKIYGSDLYSTNNKEVISAIQALGDDYVDAWSEIKTDSSFQQMLSGIDTLSAEINNLATTIAFSELGDNSTYINSKYQSAIATQYSDRIANAIENGQYGKINRDEWLKNLIQNYSSSDVSNGKAQSDSEVKKAGLEGVESKEDLARWIVARKTGHDIADVGQGGANQVQIKDLGGNTIKYKGPNDDKWQSIDYEDYAEQLWVEYVKQQESKNIEILANNAEQLGNQIKSAGVENQAIVSDMVNDYVQGNAIDLSQLKMSEIAQLDVNQVGDKEVAEALNKAKQEYVQARSEANVAASQKWIEETSTREASEIGDILQEAEMSTEDFDDYVAALQKTREVSKEVAKEIAKDSIKSSNALNKINKVIEEQKDILLEGNEASPDYITALNEIGSATEEWLGVSLDDSTLAAFVQNGTFQKALEGDTEALKELELQAAKQQIIQMDVDFTDENGVNYADKLNQWIDEIANQDIEIGASIDDSEYLASLNRMLEQGLITAEQASSYLNSIGYDPEITTKKVTTEQNYKVSGSGLVGNLLGTQTITVSADVEVPVINKEGTTYTGHSAPASTPASSGSSSSKSSSKELKTARDEIERYHQIKSVISQLETEYNKLSKAKDRAFGQERLAYMQKEIDKQEELLDQEKAYKDQLESNLWDDRDQLLSHYAVEINDDGIITNYEQVFQKELDKYNEAVSKYNNGTLTDDEFDKAELRYENFVKDIEQYEETLSELATQEQNVIDKEYELKQLSLDKVKYEIEIKVNIADDDQAYLDFLMQKTEDDAFSAAENINNFGKQVELTLQKIAANNEGITAIQDKLAAGEITPAQAAESLRELRDEIIDLNEELLSLRNSIQEVLSDGINEFNDQLDSMIEKIKYSGTMLDNYKNIVDIVGKDMYDVSTDTMTTLSKAQVTNANDLIKSVKAQLDMNKNTLEHMRQAREKAFAEGDEESVKEWDSQIKTMEETVRELEENLSDALSTGLEMAVTDFETTIEQIADIFDKAISGIYGSIEKMRDQWDRAQEIADKYLDTYKSTYEISKLNRQIQNSIEASNNTKSQKELRDIQEEMQAMSKENQKLSKYDLEYLQKKYELTLAQQALDDAKNAKSTVRLRKDSEGNFGYVYTTDQDAVNDASQKYEDALYAYQEFNQNMDKELAESFISIQEKMAEEIESAAEKYGYGTEEFMAEMEKVTTRYSEDMYYITSEYEKMTSRNVEINQQFSAGVAETYQKTFLYQIQPNYNSFSELYSATTDICENSTIALGKAISDLKSTFDAQLELAGIDASNFSNTLHSKFTTAQTDSNNTAAAVQSMATKMDEYLNGTGGAIDKVEDFQSAFSKKMGLVRDATDTTIQTINSLIKTYEALADVTPEEDSDLSGKGTDDSDNDDDKKKKSSSMITGINKKGVWDNGDIKVGNTTYHTLDNGKTYYAADGKTRYDDSNLDKIQLDTKKQSYTAKDLFTNMGKDDYIKIDTRYANKKTIGDKVWYQLGGTDMWFDTSTASKEGDNVYKWRRGDSGVWYETSAGLSEWEATDTIQNDLKRQRSIEATIKSYIPNGATTFGAHFRGNSKYNVYNDKLEATGEKINGSAAMVIYANDIRWKKINGELKSFLYFDSDDYGKGYIRASSIYPITKDNTNQSVFSGFDTGGYTGSWGPEGRLAMLHQKEIVLNSHDTENFLSAINLVRDISDKLESNAAIMRYQMALGGFKTSLNTSGDTLQQEVHITAEFPNATNHSEIEEAFKNLTNLASQYANRK